MGESLGRNHEEQRTDEITRIHSEKPKCLDEEIRRSCQRFLHGDFTRGDDRLMGSGGSSYQVRTRDPEPNYLRNVRSKVIDAVMPSLQTFSADNWTNAQNTANQALSQQSALMSQLPGALNKSSGIADEIATIARTGNIPSPVANSLNASVNKELQSGMGTMLNNMAGRGIVNSSITG